VNTSIAIHIAPEEIRYPNVGKTNNKGRYFSKN
jgi:hypothetical protein